MIQFDAHPDLWDELDGNRLSHASPFARIMETCPSMRLIQVGLRNVNWHHREQSRRFGHRTSGNERPGPLARVRPGRPRFIFPSTSTLWTRPARRACRITKPAGLTTRQALDLLRSITGPIVGADVVELNPDRDPSGITAAAAAKLIKEISGMMLIGKKSRSTTGRKPSARSHRRSAGSGRFTEGVRMLADGRRGKWFWAAFICSNNWPGIPKPTTTRSWPPWPISSGWPRKRGRKKTDGAPAVSPEVQAALDVLARRRMGTDSEESRAVNLAGARLSGARLAGANLAGANLAGANLTRSDLTDANLARARLEGAELDEALLLSANLEEARLNKARLRKVKMDNAILKKAALKEADLSGAVLWAAHLEEADLEQAVIKEAKLGFANLRKASLRKADLSGSELWSVHLEGARLHQADLSGADLRQGRLSHALLFGAKLQRAYLWKARLDAAVLTEANLSEATLKEADLQGAWLDLADLSRADLTGADLGGARLSGAALQWADLTGATLRKAEFLGDVYRAADLTGASLTRADLSQAHFQSCQGLSFDQLLEAGSLHGVKGLDPDLENRLRSEKPALFEPPPSQLG